MTERDKILGCIREALRVPAPVPGAGHNGVPATQPQATDFRELLPPVPSAPEQRLELFAKTAADLKADLRRVSNLEQAGAVLRELRDAEGWKKVAIHTGELVEPACRALSLPVCRTDQAYDPRELESCEAGITECDALVAQTGSVLLTSRSAGGRALSVLPPHHVVLATRCQLLADLPEALALLQRRYGSDYPSFISFITGPSRTGDIERILVLGAHGPKKLTIILLEQS
jgi:L-lactate dehydrogenase complex protein LldG